MTRTMKMVSATKLRRAQEAQRRALDYGNRVDGIIGLLSRPDRRATHPLLETRPRVRRILVLLASSDRGLCGSFNHQVIRKTAAWVADRESRAVRVEFSFCGRRGFLALRDHVRARRTYEGATAKPAFAQARAISAELREAFLSGRYDEVHLAFNSFQGPMKQAPVVERLLPLRAEFPRARAAASVGFLFEPPAPELLAWLVPKIVDFRIYRALLDSAAGEHGARMTAMDSATTNAEKMINTLTRLRNRARQAAITRELIEVVSGAEALGK